MLIYWYRPTCLVYNLPEILLTVNHSISNTSTDRGLTQIIIWDVYLWNVTCTRLLLPVSHWQQFANFSIVIAVFHPGAGFGTHLGRFVLVCYQLLHYIGSSNGTLSGS